MFDSLTNVAKYVILTVNFIFMILAILLMTFGILPIVYGGYDSTYGIIAITVGVTVFVVSFLGCCGAAKENAFFLMSHGVILLILFVVLIILGILAAIAIGNGTLDENVMNDFLEKIFNSTDYDNIHTSREIEIWFKCCGVKDYTDYQDGILPGSCCGERKDAYDDGQPTCPIGLQYKIGCGDELQQYFEDNVRWISGIAICLGIFEITGAIFTFWTVRHLKKKHHSND